MRAKAPSPKRMSYITSHQVTRRKAIVSAVRLRHSSQTFYF